MDNLLFSFINVENIKQTLSIFAGLLVFIEILITWKWIRTSRKVKKIDFNSFENVNMKNKFELKTKLKIWFWIIFLTIFTIATLILFI